MLDRLEPPAGGDRLDRVRLDQCDPARQRGKGIGEQLRHPRQSGEIARAAVYRDPGFEVRQHRGSARPFDNGGFRACKNIHGREASAVPLRKERG
ncbi:hypothetical protein GCM10009095_30460 [Sphingomonas molluscorum]|nr:hypothetical protein GCM10017606_21180 [Microbacterium terregens]